MDYTARGRPYVQSREVFYMPKGPVVGGTRLGRGREQVPCLLRWWCSWCDRVITPAVGSFFGCLLSDAPFTVLASSFIVQGVQVYKG
jgi:hypothetical protein